MSLFHARTAQTISTKFCIDLHTSSGKVLNQVWPYQPDLLTPDYPKLQNLNQIR